MIKRIISLSIIVLLIGCNVAFDSALSLPSDSSKPDSKLMGTWYAGSGKPFIGYLISVGTPVGDPPAKVTMGINFSLYGDDGSLIPAQYWGYTSKINNERYLVILFKPVKYHLSGGLFNGLSKKKLLAYIFKYQLKNNKLVISWPDSGKIARDLKNGIFKYVKDKNDKSGIDATIIHTGSEELVEYFKNNTNRIFDKVLNSKRQEVIELTRLNLGTKTQKLKKGK